MRHFAARTVGLNLGLLLVLSIACDYNVSFGRMVGLGGPVLAEPTSADLPYESDEITSDTAVFYIPWINTELGHGEVIVGHLFAQANANVDPLTEVMTFRADASARWGYFELEVPSGGWPAGSYEFTLAVDITTFGRVRFLIVPGAEPLEPQDRPETGSATESDADVGTQVSDLPDSGAISGADLDSQAGVRPSRYDEREGDADEHSATDGTALDTPQSTSHPTTGPTTQEATSNPTTVPSELSPRSSPSEPTTSPTTVLEAPEHPPGPTTEPTSLPHAISNAAEGSGVLSPTSSP